jgi:hypothetical protein
MMTTLPSHEEQDAKYAIGTVIEVEGQEIKADNGRFVIDHHFPVQPNGDQHYHWRRIGKSGKPLSGWGTVVRSGRFSTLERVARIVS